MQLTMEPVSKMVATAKALDQYGFDSLWLAEAYPWWRTHGVEVRSATALGPLLAQATERLKIGWGIISSYSRHPITIAMDARVLQEAAGPGRFLCGIGASKILMNAIGEEDDSKTRPRTNVAESLQIVRALLAGEGLDFEGREWVAHAPKVDAEAPLPGWDVPLYVGGGGPRMMEAAGELADGLITPSLTSPGFYPYALEHMRKGAEKAGRNVEDLDLGATLIASCGKDSETGRRGARELLGRYLVNKARNIRGSGDMLFEKAGLSPSELLPIVEAIERGGNRVIPDVVTDEIMAKTKVIAGSPEEVIDLIVEHRDSGCRHVQLELWGDDRDEQIRLIGEKVLPHVK
jgi:5,10-methylenetetrahydromethanopterin reductase